MGTLAQLRTGIGMAAFIHQFPYPMLQLHSPPFNIIPIRLAPKLILLHRLLQTALPKPETRKAWPHVPPTLSVGLLKQLLQRLGQPTRHDQHPYRRLHAQRMQHDACGAPPRCTPVPFFGDEALQPGKGAPSGTAEGEFEVGGAGGLEDAGGELGRLRVDLEDGEEDRVLDVAVEEERFFGWGLEGGVVGAESGAVMCIS